MTIPRRVGTTPNKHNPIHPEYGISDCCRVRILHHANTHGVANSAATFGVHPSTICNWRHRVDESLTNNVPECCGLSIGPMRRACHE